jgi:DNA polymerase alpha subunit A
VDLYDEVTEDQYKSIVRGRLQRDDLMVDGGVGCYMDNGMDDWSGNEDGEEGKYSDDEYDIKRTGNPISPFLIV